MKFFFLLVLILSASATPEVGFLQFYNQLNEPVTPYLGEKPLTMRPIQPQQASSGLLIPVGIHLLSLRSEGSTRLRHKIKVVTKETVTLCAILTKPSPNALALPKIIHLDGGHVGLGLRSVSYLTHDVALSNQVLTLQAGKTRILKNDFSKTLKVSIDGGKKIIYEREETVPETLLIWMANDPNPKLALIPIYIHTVPAGLRDDFTFGRKREEIRGLKTLQSSN